MFYTRTYIALSHGILQFVSRVTYRGELMLRSSLFMACLGPYFP